MFIHFYIRSTDSPLRYEVGQKQTAGYCGLKRIKSSFSIAIDNGRLSQNSTLYYLSDLPITVLFSLKYIRSYDGNKHLMI